MHSIARSDSQRMIESSIAHFVRDHYRLSQRRTRLAQPAECRMSLWSLYADLGLLGLAVPEQFGGVGGSTGEIATAASSLGRGLTVEPFIEVAVEAAILLASIAGPKIEKLLAGLIRGTNVIVIADGRSRYRGGINVRRHNSAFEIDGCIPVISYAAAVTHFVVTSVDEGGTISLYEVPRGAVGMTVRSFRTIDGRMAGDLVFDQCVLADDSLLGAGPRAARALELANRWGRFARCAEAIGIMASLLEMTSAYLKERIQFGTPIGSNQALQHRFADIFIEFMECHAMLIQAVQAIDTGDESNINRCVLACAELVERASARVGHDSIQLHGAIGATDELPVSHGNARLAAIRQQLAGDRSSWDKIRVFAGIAS